VVLLLQTTLVEKIRKNFTKVKIKSRSVKVPKLKSKKTRTSVKQTEEKQIPTSQIVNILIKTALEKARKERKEKHAVEDDKSYTPVKEERPSIFGGYGTVSRSYGTAPTSSYVDYGKLFSYLGKFRAKSAYEDFDGPVGFLNKSLESGSFVLADKETIDKGTTYIRYFHPKVPVDKTSLVPLPGMSSAEWEEFKWFMRLDTAMYLLKISTS